MKIESIDIRTVMGARAVQITPATPITIVAGGNGAGKSSVLECVRIALGEDPLRVSLKKEYGELVTEGAKNGRVNIVIDGETYGVTFPEGKRYGPAETSLYLPYVLDTSRFAAMSEAERRTMLFSLTHCQITGKKVAELLAKRGCHAEKSEQAIQRQMKGGFPAAVEFAKEQARDRKADWRAITGEAWGATKAADWKALAPAFDERKLKHVTTQIEAIKSEADEHAQLLGRLQEQHRQFKQWKEGDAARKEQIARLPSLRAKLECDEKELHSWTEKVQACEQIAGDGPRVGLVHDLARALRDVLERVTESAPCYDAARATLDAYDAQHGPIDAQADPQAQSRLSEAIKARDLMQRAVENTRRDIAAAEHAASLVDSLDIPRVGDEEISAAQGKVQGLRRELDQLEQERADLDRAAQAAKAAQSNTERAAQFNTDVAEWLAIAEALSPDGIPGEILSAALAPVNDRLRESARATGWRQVALSADMQITAGGRPYALLSESEQWRSDAMLAEMISCLSGLKLLVLDRADLLEPAARPELFGWLHALVEGDALDTALVGITLKQRPSGLLESMTTIWLEDGVEHLEASEPAEAVA